MKYANYKETSRKAFVRHIYNTTCEKWYDDSRGDAWDVYDDADATTTARRDADEMDALRDIFDGTHWKGGAY